MDKSIGEHLDGDVLIDGTKIAAVGPNLGPVDAHEIDGRGMIVLPGFSTPIATPGSACCATPPPTGAWRSISAACAASWVDSIRPTTCTSATTSARSRRSTPASRRWSTGRTTTTARTCRHGGQGSARFRHPRRLCLRQRQSRMVPGQRPADEFRGRGARPQAAISAPTRALCTMAFAARGMQFATLDTTERDFMRRASSTCRSPFMPATACGVSTIPSTSCTRAASWVRAPPTSTAAR